MEFDHVVWRKSTFSGSETACVEIAYPARWRKSSFSSETADCVEIAYPAQWRKSSLSAEGADCVEIAYPAEASRVGVRDSKNTSGGVLLVSLPAWEALRRSVQR